MEDNRTKIIGFRVTEEELKKIEVAAKLSNKKTSDWCKDAALKIASRDHNVSLGLINLGDKIIIEQLLFLRILLTNTLTNEELTEEKLKRIIKKANEMKKEKAVELIKEFMSEGLGSIE